MKKKIPVKKKIDKNVERMRKASGRIDDSRLIVAFLYTLMRDLVPPGRIEHMMLEVSNAHDYDKSEFTKNEYTNGWLAQYAQDVAQRLTENRKTKLNP